MNETKWDEMSMKNLTVETIVKICDGVLYGEEFLKESGKEAAGGWA